MKLDLIKILIAIGIAFLIGWGFYSMAQKPDDGTSISIVMGLETLLLGVGLVGIDYDEYPRSGTMIRAACALGIVVLLALNAIYLFVGINTSFYVINGIISLILLLVVNSIYKSKQ